MTHLLSKQLNWVLIGFACFSIAACGYNHDEQTAESSQPEPSTSSKAPEQEPLSHLKVLVPTSSQSEVTQRPSREKIILVNLDGTVVYEGKKLTQVELLPHLKKLVAADENQPILLRGGIDCTWQTMTDIIDTCQKAGLWNISFAVQTKKKKQGD